MSDAPLWRTSRNSITIEPEHLNHILFKPDGLQFRKSASLTSYDALTTTRSYRPAMTTEQALAEITKCRGSLPDPVFDAFIRVLGEPPAHAAP